MTTETPRKPDPGGMVNDPKDPTQRMPETPDAAGVAAGVDDEARRILEQQHTGNHQKPGDEDADRRGGTREGAGNVEPSAGKGKDRQTG